MIKLWLILTVSFCLSSAAPLNPKVDKEATEVAGDTTSVDIGDDANLDSDGLHGHTDREARITFQGGAVSFGGSISSTGDHNHITNNIASIISLSPIPGQSTEGASTDGPSTEGTSTDGVSTEVVNGDWSSWSEFSACSASCGDGTKTRTRTCSNPRPNGGGQDCEGSSYESAQCNVGPCGTSQETTRAPTTSPTTMAATTAAATTMAGTQGTSQGVPQENNPNNKIDKIDKNLKEIRKATADLKSVGDGLDALAKPTDYYQSVDEKELLEFLYALENLVDMCQNVDSCKSNEIKDATQKLTSTFRKIQNIGKVNSGTITSFGNEKTKLELAISAIETKALDILNNKIDKINKNLKEIGEVTAALEVIGDGLNVLLTPRLKRDDNVQSSNKKELPELDKKLLALLAELKILVEKCAIVDSCDSTKIEDATQKLTSTFEKIKKIEKTETVSSKTLSSFNQKKSDLELAISATEKIQGEEKIEALRTLSLAVDYGKGVVENEYLDLELQTNDMKDELEKLKKDDDMREKSDDEKMIIETATKATTYLLNDMPDECVRKTKDCITILQGFKSDLQSTLDKIIAAKKVSSGFLEEFIEYNRRLYYATILVQDFFEPPIPFTVCDSEVCSCGGESCNANQVCTQPGEIVCLDVCADNKNETVPVNCFCFKPDKKHGRICGAGNDICINGLCPKDGFLPLLAILLIG